MQLMRIIFTFIYKVDGRDMRNATHDDVVRFLFQMIAFIFQTNFASVGS